MRRDYGYFNFDLNVHVIHKLNVSLDQGPTFEDEASIFNETENRRKVMTMNMSNPELNDTLTNYTVEYGKHRTFILPAVKKLENIDGSIQQVEVVEIQLNKVAEFGKFNESLDLYESIGKLSIRNWNQKDEPLLVPINLTLRSEAGKYSSTILMVILENRIISNFTWDYGLNDTWDPVRSDVNISVFSFDNKGSLLLKFNREMKVPEIAKHLQKRNLQETSDREEGILELTDILELEYFPDYEASVDYDNLNIEYGLNFWNSSFMGLSLNFSDPYDISKGTYKDLLEVKVKRPEYFISLQGK